MQKRITIIGAGIVGACTALALAKKGASVSIIERTGPAAACSFGNAGALSPGSCVPLSVPGQWTRIPRWLAQPEGPLHVSPVALFTQAPWFARFLRAGSTRRAERSARALRSLMSNTFENYQLLTAGSAAAELIHREGSLYVYHNEKAWRADRYGWALRERHGIEARTVDADFIHEKVPALGEQFNMGVFLPDHGYCANPAALVQRLTDDAMALGADFVVDDVRRLVVTGNRVSKVVCEHGEYPTDTLVIAAGVESASLARQVGVRVPLARERGYHLTFQDPGLSLELPVMCAAGKFFLTPMEMGIRVAGTSEFTVASAPPNARRIRALMRQAGETLPGLNTQTFTQWMGERPSLPDSVPVISPAPRMPSVYLAFGHGHMGLSAASTTARLLAEMIGGETPSLDPTPFSARRFANGGGS